MSRVLQNAVVLLTHVFESLSSEEHYVPHAELKKSPKTGPKKKPRSGNRTGKRAPSLEGELQVGFPGQVVTGVDEVGRGCLFGPVVTAAVILPADVSELIRKKEYRWLKEVKDSKLLTPEEREELAPKIQAFARSWCVAEASVTEIDTLNIHHATLLAMKRAVLGLSVPVNHVLVDGKFGIPGLAVPCTALVGGDMRSLSIACASIVAKVHRDRSMIELAVRYPGYGFESHKGYSTPEHKEALQRLGPTEQHRRSFSPVRISDQGSFSF